MHRISQEIKDIENRDSIVSLALTPQAREALIEDGLVVARAIQFSGDHEPYRDEICKLGVRTADLTQCSGTNSIATVSIHDPKTNGHQVKEIQLSL